MGLKVFNDEIAKSFIERDKIRPKWDWKGSLSRTFKNWLMDKIRPKWDWKALISLRNDNWRGNDKIRPKWDWKYSYSQWMECLHCSDKIRPKWDWKIGIIHITITTNSAFVVIKSDQNGIESCLPFSWRSTSRSRIKSDQNGIESDFIDNGVKLTRWDKIRPKWDWKQKTTVIVDTGDER